MSLNVHDDQATSAITHPTKRPKVTKQPKYTIAEWDAKREIIIPLYILGNWPLSMVEGCMQVVFGFDASHSMYTKKLSEWHVFKNESSSQSHSRMNGRIRPLYKRRRYAGAKPRILAECQSGPAFLWTTHDLEPGWPSAELRALGCILYSTGNYLKGLFDQGRPGEASSGWKVNLFGLTPPQGLKDYSTEWKAIADQCHGASALISQGNGTQQKCQRTLLNVFKGIDQLAQQEDPWMLVYLWRIILYLRGISYRIEKEKVGIPSTCLGPQNDHLVGHVISSLAGLFIIRKGSGMMVDCLNSLRVFSLDRMKLAIERVFKFCTDSFQKLLGGSHPVVLIMVARFLRYWPAALADNVLANYETLVARSGTEFGSSDERTISFLTEYMYVAYYHGHDITLTYQLASDLCQRSEELGHVPQWGKKTYGLVLASKLLARIDKEKGNIDRWYDRLTPLAEKLRNGDRECQTRALQIRRMMAHWYREAGNRTRAEEQRGHADEILNSMRELVVEQGNWNLNWPFESGRCRPSELARVYKQHS
ncbi:hypothetical protein CFIO01_10506 [Colletotrichum fioriniae PJ7]|uniref:Clr5 domain-containing protein n=1 Tax=Colletotrichum fioriniae PJ7 TaxID=1445577 RepID=A0A010RSE7_9PEZI|nr:hypothetical protein CFIO01_10506 [Colletotrichum fioriniae PJ7]